MILQNARGLTGLSLWCSELMVILFVRHAVCKIYEPRRAEFKAWGHLGNWKENEVFESQY